MPGKNDDSLARASEIKGELLHIGGRQDPHVPLEGRRQILARLDEVGANYQWVEVTPSLNSLTDSPEPV